MLRLNLSTRPFYNERAVHLALAGMWIVLALVTVLNAWKLVTLSAQQTELSAKAGVDEARAADLRKQAQQVRATVRQDDLEQVLASAREANDLIDRRTFSWTELLNHIESTLPPDVMLSSVQPAFNDGAIAVRLNVIGRQVDDIDTFMRRLEKTGAFRKLLSRDEQRLDNGSYQASIETIYVAASRPGAAPGQAAPDATAASSSGGRR